MKKNSRNTLLLVAGVTQIIKSFAYCVVLLITAFCFDIIDLTIKRMIYLSTTYSLNTALGEKLITLITVAIFVYLGVAIVLNFVSGIIYLEESKIGNRPLRNRPLLITMAIVGVFTGNTLFASILVLVSLIVDRQQPEEEVELKLTPAELKTKVDAIKQLKLDKNINQEEYINMLTKLIIGN